MSPLRSGYAGLHLAHAHDERSAFGARQERAGGAAGVSLAAHVLFLLVTYVVVARPDPSRVASAPQPDGTVTDVRLSRSLDRVFGLDEEAIKAVRQWRFKPATRLGQPVAVYVTIGVGFTMH